MPASRPDLALLPRPSRMSSLGGRLTLDRDTTVRALPGAEPAADLLRSLVGPAAGLPLAPSPEGRIVLALDEQLGGLGEEGYGLTVSPQALLLRAAHPTGLLRGVQTIRQLLPAEALSGGVRGPGSWELPCVEITDIPELPWRGSLLDVARHFRPMDYLLRYVDLLALHKLNTLHLHLTDDQGWRMPVDAYPRLTEQMVFGDGDGEIFLDFTYAIDVIAHELAHGLTQYTANLRYEGQSGALNESVSDVFGSLVKQYSLGQSAEQADWLIGAGLLAPRVSGDALRSMKAPGTAYDDDVLGKDPQPASMEEYVETEEDNGGVHINSGIPNRAFYLLATALGGNAWERAGQIWFDVLTGGELTATADFAEFARLTVAAAGDRFGERGEREAVLKAWSEVGVPTAE
ncbi:M4 family metallopeptidase [Streptomyces microflavus]|uniref:M4 family metallopeptidase n=1 Tax=Streptomyces microflavus TaxID=1919 RepID=UPI0033B36AB9